MDQFLSRHLPQITTVVVGLLLTFFVVFSMSLAIQFSDTDLWFHMAGGRHLLERGELYDPLWYSFLDIEDIKVKHLWSWLFQVTVYTTWSLVGEFGLIVLKSVLITLSAVLAMKVVLRDEAISRAGVLQLTVIILIVGLLCYRDFNLRPHLVTYVMIPLFVWILAWRRSLYPLLPLLTLLWVNFHGIEWVVGALILGGYFLRESLSYLDDSDNAERLKAMGWIASCAPLVVLNPNTVYLVLAPFVTLDDLGMFITELHELQLTPVLDFTAGLELNSLILLLLGFVVAGFATLIRSPRQYLPELLMAVGGLVLLTMGKRFVWDWALLSLPLISAAIPHWQQPRLNWFTLPFLLGMILLLPLTFWPAMKTGWQHYPYDRHSLPYGTTEFISKLELEGSYAIEPSFAGYVMFVRPDIKIHMDMQTPPFTPLNYHDIHSAMINPAALNRFVAQYQPDMLGVVRTQSAFPQQQAKKLGYAPVFFDSKIILYLNRATFPEVVKRFELKAVNPFNPEQVMVSRLDEAAGEFERMLAQVDMPEIRLKLVGLLIEANRAERAGIHLESLRKSYPGNRSVAWFSGRLAQQHGDCRSAVDDFKQALGGEDDKPIHLRLAQCYFLISDPGAAYRHFRQAINPFEDLAPNDLSYYQFALSAIGAGRNADAAQLLRMLLHFHPNTPLRADVESLLTQLEST